MNKTIIININGTVFHIEEDAYEVLKNYMTDVKRHFMNSADSLEITTDIENRIAEMFSEILTRDSKQALVEADVQFVIEQMGRVEDFASAEEDSTAEQPFFAETKTTSRKLFRDADERVIGGVCSGIASYFDLRSVWIRLAFIIAVLFFGTGFILYIILWLVVPKAATRADRMAMKGEKLNLQGFKRNFEEEMTGLKGSMSNFSDEARPFIYRARDFVGDLFTHFGSFLRTSGKFIIKALGVTIVICSFLTIIGLAVVIIAFLAYGNMGIYNWFPFNIVNYQANVIFLICGFLLVGIPLLTIILLAVTLLFKNFSFNRATGFTLLAIWLTSVFVVIYYSAQATADFRYPASFRKTVTLKPSSNGIYYLRLNDIKYLTGEDSTRLNIKERFKGLTIVDKPYSHEIDGPGSTVYLSIERGDVAAPKLIEEFSARGKTFEEALINARATSYQFFQQDSVLNFSPKLDRQSGALWRAQSLNITIKVPLNTVIVVEDEVNRLANNFDIWGCRSMNGQDSGSSTTFIMTADGLQCKVNTPPAPPNLPASDTVAIAKDTVITTTKK
ncbi:PspC domain-containing protein [Mucilaginibacter sp. UR6-1]|uniref:PspC domain-containing protein n=1 Tax=Mucilaginibacter sp. UR6-1 TaxID=1435643 RepID=UPI001E28BB00|nr:PspC domain-containing protein [Mucilaginibacter sp. UR6-1]MCC8410897.1 PspC domain-containing protein [Mucilaginibacter sp. UR6-1]